MDMSISDLCQKTVEVRGKKGTIEYSKLELQIYALQKVLNQLKERNLEIGTKLLSIGKEPRYLG